MQIKIIATWGQIGAVGVSGGKTVAEVGWVRARAEDGSCYIYTGTNGSTIQSFNGGIRAFTARVDARGNIDSRYWTKKSGAEAQETTPAAEYRDANDR